MKIIKSIILFFALILGFLLQSEVFQSQLWSFDTAYYMATKYNIKDDEVEVFFKDILDRANMYGVKVFSTNIYMDSEYKTTLNIYGNEEEIRESLYNKINIEEKTYNSLFSGITDVKYREFVELYSESNNSKNFISFIGEKDNIVNIYEDLSQEYDITYPEYWESTERDAITIVWSMIIFLIIVMNCIDVLRRKKEVVIRVSLGEGARWIIVKSIIVSLLQYIVIYIAARIFIYNYISGEYEQKLAFSIYIIGILFSMLPYSIFAFYDIRKTFHNVNDSNGVLVVLYGLKIIVTVLTIFTITTNLSSIHWNVFSDDSLIEQYKNYSFIKLRDTGLGDYNDEDIFWDKVYENKYDVIKPVICINILEDDLDFILVNKNAKGMMQGFTNMLDKVKEDTDYTIFIPKSVDLQKNKEEALSLLDSYIKYDINKLNIQVIQYNTRQSFAYMSSQELYAIRSSINPVVIYQNNDYIQFDGSEVQSYASNEIMFDINQDELEIIKENYSELICNYEIVQTNVDEYYSYQKSFVLKLISFLSSLCIIVFILDVAVIIAISSMEYRNHSMEISLKKIFGYGIYERNRRVFTISIIADFLATIVLCICGVLFGVLAPKIVIIVGILIISVEILIILYNIMRVEKENVHKILKGGCL